MPDGNTTATEPQLLVSDNAAKRIQALAAEDGKPGTMLRVSVAGGGCSGFKYGFALDATANADDRIFKNGGAAVVVDEVSLGLLNGSVVDFVEDLMGAYFAIKNPNASSTCGCGSSFSV